MPRRKILSEWGAHTAADRALDDLADAMRRAPDRATRASILNRAMAALAPLAPSADLREELDFVRRECIPLFIPGYRPTVPLAVVFPGLLARGGEVRQ